MPGGELPAPELGYRPQCSCCLSRLFLLLWRGAVWDHLGLCVEAGVFGRGPWGHMHQQQLRRVCCPQSWEGSQQGAGHVDELKGLASYCRVGILEMNRDGWGWAQLCPAWVWTRLVAAWHSSACSRTLHTQCSGQHWSISKLVPFSGYSGKGCAGHTLTWGQTSPLDSVAPHTPPSPSRPGSEPFPAAAQLPGEQR